MHVILGILYFHKYIYYKINIPCPKNKRVKKYIRVIKYKWIEIFNFKGNKNSKATDNELSRLLPYTEI